MSQSSGPADSGLPGSEPSHTTPSTGKTSRSAPSGPGREPAAQRRARRWWSYAVAGVAVVGFFLAIVAGRRDSALLFVGLPGLLAVATTLSPARTLHGLTFKAITVSLEHADFTETVEVVLQTDGEGRIELGALERIASLTASSPQGVSQRWPLSRPCVTPSPAM